MLYCLAFSQEVGTELSLTCGHWIYCMFLVLINGLINGYKAEIKLTSHITHWNVEWGAASSWVTSHRCIICVELLLCSSNECPQLCLFYPSHGTFHSSWVYSVTHTAVCTLLSIPCSSFQALSSMRQYPQSTTSPLFQSILSYLSPYATQLGALCHSVNTYRAERLPGGDNWTPPDQASGASRVWLWKVGVNNTTFL